MHYRRWLNYADPLMTIYGQPKVPCSIEGCESPSMGRSWCSKHYERWKRNGDPLLITREEPGRYTNVICRAPDCPGETKALGLCGMHYARWCKFKSLDLPPRKPRPRKNCSIQNCRKPVECREMCGLHYQRWRQHGDPNILAILLPVPPCAAPDCENRTAKCGVCWKHYRWYRKEFHEKQHGLCAICAIPEAESPGKKLCLDHNHSGDLLPRGLLCRNCNSGLGHFKDNPERLAVAITYLAASAAGRPISPALEGERSPHP